MDVILFDDDHVVDGFPQGRSYRFSDKDFIEYDGQIPMQREELANIIVRPNYSEGAVHHLIDLTIRRNEEVQETIARFNEIDSVPLDVGANTM